MSLIALKNEQEWLDFRDKGIGSSDAAVICDLNPWKSRFTLWSEKTGKVAKPDLSDVEPVIWGKKLEGLVADHYSEETHRTLEDYGYHVFRNPDREFIQATLDRGILDENPGVLEIKTTSAYKRDDWLEEPPLYYQVQLQHALMASQRDWGSFAVLIGGQKFYWMDVQANEKFQKWLLEKEEEFWDMVQKDIPPSPDGSKSTADTIAQVYETMEMRSVVLPGESMDMTQKYVENREEIKRLEAENSAIANQMKVWIGSAAVGVQANGERWTYKTVNRKAYEVAAKSFRVLRYAG